MIEEGGPTLLQFAILNDTPDFLGIYIYELRENMVCFAVKFFKHLYF